MARILVLNPPFSGLSTTVNVIQQVGPNSKPNDPGDVEVIQTLLGVIKSNFAKKVGLPAITGNFDGLTGFWIYNTQNVMKTKRASRCDRRWDCFSSSRGLLCSRRSVDDCAFQSFCSKG